jgi:hypothetical protein
MRDSKLNAADLAQFTDSERRFCHPLVQTYTEGAQYVAEHGGANWVLDAVAPAPYLVRGS